MRVSVFEMKVAVQGCGAGVKTFGNRVTNLVVCWSRKP